MPVLTGEQPVVELGGVHAVEDDGHRVGDLGMFARAPEQLRQERQRQRLRRGRKGAPLVNRVTRRVIERVDRASGAVAGQIRFDVGHAMAFLYWGPTTTMWGACRSHKTLDRTADRRPRSAPALSGSRTPAPMRGSGPDASPALHGRRAATRGA